MKDNQYRTYDFLQWRIKHHQQLQINIMRHKSCRIVQDFFSVTKDCLHAQAYLKTKDPPPI